MRRIEVKKWSEPTANGVVEQNTLKMLEVVFTYVPDKDIPKGFKHFSSFARIGDAFKKAEITGLLELEEAEYKLLKDMVERFVPAGWALNQGIADAVNSFVNADEVK